MKPNLAIPTGFIRLTKIDQKGENQAKFGKTDVFNRVK
jgi:hypothetical protein